ncbi:MAG TPA: F0F1 ATP synthase subunit C [bacterium]|nr:F0F1 ATP synthase subunit C [bacterium]
MKRILAFLGVCGLMFPLWAEETVATATGGMEKGLIALGAGLAIGIAAIGGALGQGRAAAAAMEGTARNPESSKRLFILLILSLALIESLVIYALVVSFSLIGKL